MIRALILAAAGVMSSAAAQTALSAGAAVDTVLSWESYDSPRSARIRIYDADDRRRPRTVVVDEHASRGGSVGEDARFLAEQAGRRLGFDPAEATFVFRYTASSFVSGATDGGRSLLLRATFRRSESGGLGPPAWRVISPAALEELTSRQLR
jgi:hypothetical protein